MIVCVCQYIYKALFQEGKNHDVTLVIFGKEWNLHKIYLCQVWLCMSNYS